MPVALGVADSHLTVVQRNAVLTLDADTFRFV